MLSATVSLQDVNEMICAPCSLSPSVVQAKDCSEHTLLCNILLVLRRELQKPWCLGRRMTLSACTRFVLILERHEQALAGKAIVVGETSTW